MIVAVAVEGGEPPPEPQSTLASASTTPAPAFAARTPARPTRVLASQLVAGAGVLLDGAMLPAPASGVEATMGWAYRWSNWRVRATAGGSYVARTASAVDARGEGGSFSLLAASARACGAFARAAFDLGPCLGAEFDVVLGDGFGPTGSFHASPTAGMWWSAVGSLLGSWSLSPAVAVYVRGDGLALVGPSRWFVISTPGSKDTTVHQLPSFDARGALGLEVRFF